MLGVLRWTLPWVILAASLLSVDASWQVEHAFGDEAFTSSGVLEDGMEGLQLVRNSVSTSFSDQLRQLIQDGGFYRLRASAEGKQAVQTAVPARCLKAGEKLLAVMTSSGELASLSYDLSEVDCDPTRSSEADNLRARLPKTVPVTVVKPATAETIKQQPKPLDGSKPGARKPAAAAKKAEAAQGQPKGEKGPEGADGEAEKPPDNRSWIQKNWIFIIPAVLMLVNGFGGAQQRARAPAGPAAAQPRPRQSR